MTERGNNIVIIYADCTPEADAEYNRWYDTRHMPQRLTVPGYLATVRYQNTGKGAKYVMLYELSGADVLDSAPVKQISATYDDWDRKMMAAATVEARGVYQRVFTGKQTVLDHAPFLITVRIEVDKENDAEFNDWYGQDHMPGLAVTPGVRAARRYRQLSGNSSTYLAVYELDDGNIRQNPVWQKASDTEWTRRMLPKLKNPRLTEARRVF